jgi:diamine N-acetyltransferase
MKLRPLTEADIPAFQMLARRIWRLHYPSIISLEQIEGMVDIIYDEARLKAELARGVSFLLAEHQSEMIAFVAWEQTETPGLYFLHKLYVHPDHHNKGIASRLLDEVEQRTPDLQAIELLTHRRNAQAVNFYQRKGFEIIAEPETHVGPYVFTDYRFRKVLRHVARAAV